MKPNYKEIKDILELLEISELKQMSLLNFLPKGREKVNAGKLLQTEEKIIKKN